MFAMPGLVHNRTWRAYLAERGIRFHPVPRGADSTRDPNDDAICREALRLAKSPVQAIALLARNADFVQLAAKLDQQGKVAIVVFSSASPSQKQLFSQAGWQVLVAKEADFPVRMKAFLLSDGSGGIDYLDPPESLANVETCDDTVVAYLRSHGYMSTNSSRTNASEIAPAIAKLWYCNQFGRLDVFPYWYALQSMLDLIRATPEKVSKGHGQAFAFVLPVRRHKREPLDDASARIAAGGGPFIMRNSHDLVERVLFRLGYMDSCLNTDLSEAMLVFSRMAVNKRQLSKIGLYRPGVPLGASELKAAILSDAHGPTWQLPPQSGSVVQYLVARGLLPSAQVPTEDVHEAMKSICAANGLPAMRTYNGYLWQFQARVLNLNDPSRRPS
ncbi:unnamed protein product [Prorocentrum cordatum]|uniref:NYN domain-containing protein n=1 Tax=Prorocentrum cordatum TaxID=2364126 RepID=A0ABN9VCZ8_9DINO|nr:unnamed protein product [Polarella glacialis]